MSPKIYRYKEFIKINENLISDKNLKCVAFQVPQFWEDKESNWEMYKSLSESISEVDLMIFPEMFDTGFTMNLNIVEEWGDNNSSLNFLKNLSENKNAAIYTSFATKENESYFNRGVFVFPDGNIEIYDKRKLFIPQSEDKYFTPGENEKIVNYKGWKINLQICNDLRFPELSINKNENNDIKYDILINVANWSSGGLLDWQTLLTARSIENQSYVIGVNRIGKDNNGFEYIGDTLVFNPLGESEDLINVSEYLWIFELDYIDLQRIRKFYPSESSEKN